MQPASQGITRVAGDMRVTEWLAPRILSLPMYAELEAAQLGYVANSLRRAWGNTAQVAEAGMGVASAD